MLDVNSETFFIIVSIHTEVISNCGSNIATSLVKSAEVCVVLANNLLIIVYSGKLFADINPNIVGNIDVGKLRVQVNELAGSAYFNATNSDNVRLEMPRVDVVSLEVGHL